MATRVLILGGGILAAALAKAEAENEPVMPHDLIEILPDQERRYFDVKPLADKPRKDWLDRQPRRQGRSRKGHRK